MANLWRRKPTRRTGTALTFRKKLNGGASQDIADDFFEAADGGRTVDLGVTLAGCVVAAAATLAATAALAIQLAGATVGSGATVPVVVDLGKTLTGTSLSATA